MVPASAPPAAGAKRMRIGSRSFYVVEHDLRFNQSLKSDVARSICNHHLLSSSCSASLPAGSDVQAYHAHHMATAPARAGKAEDLGSP